EDADDFERTITHLDVGADCAPMIPEEGISNTEADHHRVAPMLIVEVADETAVADRYIRRLRIVGGDATQVSSPVRVALIRDGAIETPIRKCDEGDVFDRICVFKDRLCIIFR